MKKTITWACLLISFITIAMSFNIGESLLMFVIIGAIPGTSYALPADGMMTLYAIGFIAFTNALYKRQVSKFISGSASRLTPLQSE